MLTKILESSLLISGYLFTFLIPGMYIVECYFSKFPKKFKLPLYMLLSVTVSTYLIYFVSLLIGFSRYSIIISFIFFIPWIVIHIKSISKTLFDLFKSQYLPLSFSIIVFLIYLISLYPGIFTDHDGYIVMSSSNWQDTAMHSGIIESISQGNFPPQAPYFSGVPLNYYYFTDFHSSILQTLYGNFFPRVIVYDNPLFAMIFFLSVYALSLEVTRNRLVSIFASLSASFYGSFMYINFIKDVFSSTSSNKIVMAIELLKTNSYAIEFGKFFQISPMADYFLQNRPMMIGLPSVVTVFFLVIYIYRKQKYMWMILPGIITAMLLKFQFFAMVVSFFIFGVISIFYFKFTKWKQILLSLFLFLIIPFLFYIIFSTGSSINGDSLINVVMNNFKFTPWEEGKSNLWYIQFLGANLGAPILIFIISIPTLLIIKKFNKPSWFQIGPVFLTGFLLSVIPIICRFTIMKYDMLKFYFFSEIFISIISFWFLYKIIKNKIILIVSSIILLMIITPTSFTNLINSYLNKTMAYTFSERDAGYWIRDHTKPKSVFIDLENLHSPITEVAGRLRVLSYINWPHSHGYNVGFDNVFTRLDDINDVYTKTFELDIVSNVLAKYNVDYVYYGLNEKHEFPETENLLNTSIFFERVYKNEDVSIYKVIKN